MRRPGGYGQLLGCDGPPAQLKDALGRIIPHECDSYSCTHCNRVVFVLPKERPEDTGGMCKLCCGLICPRCVDLDQCSPLEKQLDDIERAIKLDEARLQALRSYGMI